MTDYAGVFAILLVGAAAAVALGALHRRLSADAAPPASPPAAAPPAAADAQSTDDLRTGPTTRISVGFLPGVLLAIVALSGVVLLPPWALAARELGVGALLGFALLVFPPVLGLLHAAVRSADEW